MRTRRPRDAPIRGFLRPREGAAPGLPGRHDDLDLVERERQEAQILQQPASSGQGIRRCISNGLIMDATAIGVAQEEDDEQRIH